MECKMKERDEWKAGKIMCAQPKSTGKYSHWQNIEPEAEMKIQSVSIGIMLISGKNYFK